MPDQQHSLGRLTASVLILIALVCGIAHAKTVSPVKPFRYVVRTGDTPSGLASRWGLPQSFVASPAHVLKIGEELSVPLVARERMRRGGSLSFLSEKYGVSVEMLAKFNRLKPPYEVKVGQIIMVPKLK